MLIFMLATSSLKSIIQPSIKSTQQDILNKFISLLDTYKIHYILLGKQPHFVVSNLARAKGLDTVDFSKNYFDRNKKCVLPGTFKLIKGEELAKFKKAWLDANSWSFTKATSLWITDWLGAYHYLQVGYSEQAKEFKILGANAIESTVSNVISLEEKRQAKLQQSQQQYQTEETIHDAICALSSYTNRHFKREQIVVNSFTDQTARTRRFDLVEVKGRQLAVYELKSVGLTPEHIKEVIGDKGYIELAKLKYPKKFIKFYFVAPTITKSAERLLKQMVKVEFIPLDYLVNELVEDIKEEFKLAGSEWYLEKEIIPKFADVLPVNKTLKVG
jgi:hypothetical protein